MVPDSPGWTGMVMLCSNTLEQSYHLAFIYIINSSISIPLLYDKYYVSSGCHNNNNKNRDWVIYKQHTFSFHCLEAAIARSRRWQMLCLVRSCFLVADCHLLAVLTQDRMGQERALGLFYRGNNTTNHHKFTARYLDTHVLSLNHTSSPHEDNNKVIISLWMIQLSFWDLSPVKGLEVKREDSGRSWETSLVR